MDHLLPLLLSKNGIYGIDKKDLSFQLLTHPDYPNLMPITDTLDCFEIDNVPVNVPKQALKRPDLVKRYGTMVSTL